MVGDFVVDELLDLVEESDFIWRSESMRRTDRKSKGCFAILARRTIGFVYML